MPWSAFFRTSLFMGLLVGLSACTDEEMQEFWASEPEPTNAEICQSYGFQFGSDGYGDCMLRLAEMAQQRRAAILGAYIQNQQNQRSIYPGLPQSRTNCQWVMNQWQCNTFGQ